MPKIKLFLLIYSGVEKRHLVRLITLRLRFDSGPRNTSTRSARSVRAIRQARRSALSLSKGGMVLFGICGMFIFLNVKMVVFIRGLLMILKEDFWNIKIPKEVIIQVLTKF